MQGEERGVLSSNMTYIEQAKEKAREGGYVEGFMYDKLAAVDPFGAFEILLFDVKWWQALGKAMGWEKIPNPRKYALVGGWQYQLHYFVDHLIAGKSVESFFEELLKRVE